MNLFLQKIAASGAIVAGFLATGSLAGADRPSDETTDAAEPRVTRVSGEIPPAESARRTLIKVYDATEILSARHPGYVVRADVPNLVDLMVSSVAPGTWKVLPPVPTQVLWTRQPARPGSKSEKVTLNRDALPPLEDRDGQPIGSITWNMSGVSLVVRHTPAVHREFAQRLQQLKRVIVPDIDADRDRPEPPAPARPNRARQLLGELEKEIDGLIRERDRLQTKAPASPRVDTGRYPLDRPTFPGEVPGVDGDGTPALQRVR